MDEIIKEVDWGKDGACCDKKWLELNIPYPHIFKKLAGRYLVPKIHFGEPNFEISSKFDDCIPSMNRMFYVCNSCSYMVPIKELVNIKEVINYHKHINQFYSETNNWVNLVNAQLTRNRIGD